MEYFPPALERLVEQFARLPGIGRKSAQRLALFVLSLPDEDAAGFADAIRQAKSAIHCCPVCQNFAEGDGPCPICASAKRDRSVICVVETPRDVQAFERTREYHGMYHVLHGLISPMDGIGAEQLTVKELLARLGDGEVKEVIMAMNPTVEGEATAMYLAKLIKPLGIKTTRLAYGLPVGGSTAIAVGIPSYWFVNADASEEEQQLGKDFLNWLYTSETGTDYLMNKFGFLPVVDGMTSDKLDPISASVADAIASGNIVDWTFNTEWPASVIMNDLVPVAEEFFTTEMTEADFLTALNDAFVTAAAE